MIRLILISLAGVRLQSKKDSHCESFFVFGHTPGRIETLAQSDAFTIITMKMSPEGDLRQRLNHHFIESIDFIFCFEGTERFVSNCAVSIGFIFYLEAEERDRSAFIIG